MRHAPRCNTGLCASVRGIATFLFEVMLAVKNFDKFQHYKDRSPVWIKLYRSLLRDYEFAKLPDAARGQLVLIWLLASEMGNRLPNDAEWIRCQINASEAVNLAVLIEAGFLVDCDSEFASDYDASEDDSPEKRERREEKEKEREAEASSARRGSARPPQKCGEDIIAELQNSPAYAHLDVRMCYFKMVEWCKRNHKIPSEKRFINWLNREEKPMTAKPGNGAARKPDVGAPLPVAVQPADDYMAESVEELIAAGDIDSIGQIYDAIVKRGGAKAEWEIHCAAWYELHKMEMEK